MYRWLSVNDTSTAVENLLLIYSRDLLFSFLLCDERMMMMMMMVVFESGDYRVREISQFTISI